MRRNEEAERKDQIRDLQREVAYLKEQLAGLEESKDEGDRNMRILHDLYEQKVIDGEGKLL